MRKCYSALCAVPSCRRWLDVLHVCNFVCIIPFFRVNSIDGRVVKFFFSFAHQHLTLSCSALLSPSLAFVLFLFHRRTYTMDFFVPLCHDVCAARIVFLEQWIDFQPEKCIDRVCVLVCRHHRQLCGKREPVIVALHEPSAPRKAAHMRCEAKANIIDSVNWIYLHKQRSSSPRISAIWSYTCTFSALHTMPITRTTIPHGISE